MQPVEPIHPPATMTTSWNRQLRGHIHVPSHHHRPADRRSAGPADDRRTCHPGPRVKASQLVLRRDRELPDGSYLSKVYPCYADRLKDRNGIVVRIIEYTHSDPNRPGY